MRPTPEAATRSNRPASNAADRPTSLVCWGHRKGSTHLFDLRTDHITHYRPGLRRRRNAAQARIEPDQLRSPAGQYEPKHAGEQPKVDRCPAWCIFISPTDHPDGAASLPILGHAPHGVPVKVFGICGVCPEAIGQGLSASQSVEPPAGGVSISRLRVPALRAGSVSPPTPPGPGRADPRRPKSAVGARRARVCIGCGAGRLHSAV